MSLCGTLGIIPARGGSIRVPRKNIRSLGGKPLIACTIEAADSASRLDRVIVSTDDEEIAEVARSHGADVPFMRPAELATEDTPDAPVFIHALNWLGETEGFYPELLVNLRPTTPFKTGGIIDEVILTEAPITLGEGLPLFGKYGTIVPDSWSCVSERKFSDGVIQKTFRPL